MSEQSDLFLTSTSCVEDSPAKTSASPGKAQASMENEVGSGESSPASSAKVDRASSSSKTSPPSQAAGYLASCKTLPIAGTWGHGTWSPLPRLERHIDETESSSLLPTPTAASYGTGQNGTRDGVTPYRQREKASLDTLVRTGLLPTPVADDCVDRAKGKWNSRGEPKLSGMACTGLLPTPTASLPTNGGLLPTPQARDWKDGTDPKTHGRHSDSLPTVVNRGVGGSLHPRFVEWMMGFPPGWTDLDDDDQPPTNTD